MEEEEEDEDEDEEVVVEVVVEVVEGGSEFRRIVTSAFLLESHRC